jgi:DNA-binding transcriptional ArsR family regulator
MDSQLVARIAALIGDPARASMLCSLLGGESRPASELALLANISPQTASNHLRLLEESGLLVATRIGRNRFFQLRDHAVATAIEALAGASHRVAARHPRGASVRRAPDLLFARTCYDHLAGELAVGILRHMLTSKWLTLGAANYELTPRGEKQFKTLNIDTSPDTTRRRLAFPCLDWSQRVPHLGGSLGARLLKHFLAARFLTRAPNSRLIRLTDSGQRYLEQHFRLRIRHDRMGLV